MSEAPGPHQALGEALARAAERLESGDAEGAESAMTAAASACAAAGRCPPEVVAEVRRLFDRCQRAEVTLRQQLVDALGHAASGRRALDAYDR
jgi:hypothetical protein